MYPTLPAETTYSDIERNLIENEPPGMFPEDQNSYWGQMRKVFADYLQANAVDLFTAWYNNLDPRNVDANDIAEWEQRVGVPGDRSGLTLVARRTFVQNRLVVGGFSRKLINQIIEGFITATFGTSTSFDPTGISIDAGGITLFSGVTGDPKTMYRVYFDYMNRTYYVRILNTLGEDLSGLTRELKRITPAGWTLNISEVANVLYYNKMILDSAPLMYYTFDSTLGGDSSGYTVFPGTQNGGMAFAGPLVLAAANNGVGNSAFFDGIDDYITIPSTSDPWPFGQMGKLKIAVSAFFKPNTAPAAGTYGVIFSKGSLRFGIDENRKLIVDNGTQVFRSPSALTLTTTYLVGMKQSGSDLTLLVNGVPVLTSSTAAIPSLLGIGAMGRYQAGANGYLSGTLDELAVFDSIPTDAKSLEFYKTGTNVA